MADPNGTGIKIGVTESAGEVNANIAEADAAADKAVEAFFADRLGTDNAPQAGADDGATDGPARGADGKFVSKSETAAKPDGKAQSKDTTEPDAVPDGVNPSDYRKATTALQRDGVPSKVLDNMSPQEITAWGLKRAGTQAESDRLGNEVVKLKATRDKTTEKPDGEKAEPIDFSKLLEPLKAAYGDEIAEPLEALAKSIHEGATKGITEQQQRLDAMLERFTNREREDARASLAKKYQLDDDARWNRALERRKSDKNDYGTEAEAIAASCRIEFAEEIIADYEAKLKTQHDLRAKGQSTTANKGPAPVKSKTQDEQETDLLNAIMDGDSQRAQQIGRRSNVSAGELMAQTVG